MTEEQIVEKAMALTEFSGVTFKVRHYRDKYRLIISRASMTINVCIGSLTEVYDTMTSIEDSVRQNQP